MNLFNSFSDIISNFTASSGKANCPNCWGYQEFDNCTFDRHQDYQVDARNGLRKLNFIQQFTTTRIDGIKRRGYSNCA